MMVLVAINLIFLSIDILLAHGMNGNLIFNEWIPIWFGIGAGVFLFVAGLISLRQRTLAILLSFIVFAASIVVGLVGAYFHVQRAIPPNLWQSEPLIVLLIFAPPVVGPLTYSLLGVLGVIATVYEDPPNSGRMVVPGVVVIGLAGDPCRMVRFGGTVLRGAVGQEGQAPCQGQSGQHEYLDMHRMDCGG